MKDVTVPPWQVPVLLGLGVAVALLSLWWGARHFARLEV
jgi:hypothetical protein